MHSSSAAVSCTIHLETVVGTVEKKLAALSSALSTRNLLEMNQYAQELASVLADALHQFATAARHGAMPAELRQRLISVTVAMASEREYLSRATCALDRAIDVLIPGQFISLP
jgi:hypothetical protein